VQERIEPQRIPVKLYRTADMITVAAPMPGLEAENVSAEVTASGRLVMWGALRAALKDAKELLVDEWSVGPYHRDIELPGAVDGEAGVVTYGNGVVVVALPVAPRTRPARLRPTKHRHGSGA